MNIFNRLDVKKRILIVVLIPMISLAFLEIKEGLRYYANLKETASLKEISSVAPLISTVMHDLQKERGKSVGFLATSNQADIIKFRANLREIHAHSEEDRAALRAAFDQIDLDAFSPEFKRRAHAALKGLDEVVELRPQVINRTAGAAEIKKVYTAHVRDLLGVLQYISTFTSEPTLKDKLAAYVAILEVQEATGLERVLGTGALNRNDITLKDREALSEFVGKQKAFFSVFDAYATAEEKELFDLHVKQSDTFAKIEALREQFLREEQEIQLLALTSGADWFNTWSDELEKLGAVENKIREDIQVSINEQYENAKTELINMALIAAAQIIITIVLLILIANSITDSLTALTRSMKKLADDDLDFKTPDVGTGHELGDMAIALEVFRENAQQVKMMEAEQEKAKIRAEKEKKQQMNNMADSFDRRTADVIAKLMASAEEMQKASGSMLQASEMSSSACNTVAAAAEEANVNVQTVAAAAEELSSSSQEIARQVADVASRAAGASEEAEETSRSVSELNELADSIGEVVGAIKDIAEQTNLLALNATIEAARAGAAGKGFAVVADEVKKLATETAHKTEEIDSRVARIQEAIRSSVEAVTRIIDNVKMIDEATTTVASAVEEQNSATSEIGRNVSEASTGTQQVSENITDVLSASNETSETASNVRHTSDELSQISDNLRQAIQSFLMEVRTGNAQDESTEGDEDALAENQAAGSQGDDKIAAE